MSSDFNQFVFTRLRKPVVVDEVITIFYFEQPPKYRFDGESHDFWELMYIDRGELLIRLDGRDPKALKNTFVSGILGDFLTEEILLLNEK